VPVPARRATPDTLIATFIAASVAVMAVGYALDAVGLSMSPALLGIAAAIAAAAAFVTCRERAAAPAGSIALSGLVTFSAFAYLLWLASPSLLPVTDGPDVVHHLQLIHLIQRTHRLAHDPALQPYLAEMMNYTPGSHIVVASVGAWLRVDPLRVLLPVTAAFAAVRAGVVYVLALRALPPGRSSAIYALAAPVLLLVPAAFTIRSFFQFYFHAQVVSETFALAMVMAALAWLRTQDARWLVMAGASGAGVVLSWPVWIGPAAAAALVAILAGAAPLRTRVYAAAVACGPAALVALVHASTHSAGASIVGSSGVVTRPSAATLGLAFVALGVIGALAAIRSAAARAISTLLAVTILQALALASLDVYRATSASPSLYMPFKMVYLAVLPCAVLGALALAAAADVLASRWPAGAAAARVVPLLLAALLAAGRFPVKRQHSPITTPSLAAGMWARATLPPECIDYVSRHWLTGYWLHLDVLGNPRASNRMRVETFEFPDVVGKWFRGEGLPYAIVEDLDAVPRDVRAGMQTLRTFPPAAAAVVKNLRPGSDPGISLCRGK
jgi:hypothetical protein